MEKNGKRRNFYNKTSQPELRHDIKKIIRDVLKEYDHRLINDIIPYPSAENICEHICSKLSARLDFPLTVRVWEGEGKWCEIESAGLE